jgi:hypothetical protein
VVSERRGVVGVVLLDLSDMRGRGLTETRRSNYRLSSQFFVVQLSAALAANGRTYEGHRAVAARRLGSPNR